MGFPLLAPQPCFATLQGDAATLIQKFVRKTVPEAQRRRAEREYLASLRYAITGRGAPTVDHRLAMSVLQAKLGSPGIEGLTPSRTQSVATAQSAVKCEVCSELAGDQAIICSHDHAECAVCVRGQVEAFIENPAALERLREVGLPCVHSELATHGTATRCLDREPWVKVRGLVSDGQLERIERTLAEFAASKDETTSSDLKDQIHDFFNLRCPRAECAGVLDAIEGCNAATCSACESRFCYLCLEAGATSVAVHAHARAHSGNYWENRDGHTGVRPVEGHPYSEVETYTTLDRDPHTDEMIEVLKSRPYTYTDRYHWLLVREKLEARVTAPLHADLESFLRERKMWPMPAGQPTDGWITALPDSGLDARSQVALLQNELIFQVRRGHADQAQILRAELDRRGVPALLTLDVPPPRAGGAAAFAAAQLIQPVLEGQGRWNRVNSEFRGLGNMYYVAGLIWSGVAPRLMTQEEAVAFCRDTVGGAARLPTKDEYLALSRALGSRQPDIEAPGGCDVSGYKSNLLPDMGKRGFWSASEVVGRPRAAYRFDGIHGYARGVNRDSSFSVRCVVD